MSFTDLGNSDGMVSITIRWPNTDKVSIRYGKYASKGYSDGEKETRLQVFILREAGVDLLSVVDREVDDKYFNDFKNNIANKTKGVRFIDVNT